MPTTQMPPKERLNELAEALHDVSLVQCRYVDKRDGANIYKVKMVDAKKQSDPRVHSDEAAHYDTVSFAEGSNVGYKDFVDVLRLIMQKRKVEFNHHFYTRFLGLDRPQATRVRDTALSMPSKDLKELLRSTGSIYYTQTRPKNFKRGYRPNKEA